MPHSLRMVPDLPTACLPVERDRQASRMTTADEDAFDIISPFIYTLSMKSGICLATILIFSASALAHPGKTDGQGGHKCWKNCEEWELVFSEYHLHDEDWKPIRLDTKGNPLHPVRPEGTDTPGPEKQLDPAKPVEETKTTVPKHEEEQKRERKKTVVEHRYEIIAREDSILSFGNVLLLALAMLLLIALFFTGRRKD